MRADSMYYLNKGTVVYRGNVVVGGNVWGEDCIISRIEYRSRPARALTYVEISQISGEEMTAIMTETVRSVNDHGEHVDVYVYPHAAKKLRFERIRMSLLAEARVLLQKKKGKDKWDVALGNMELQDDLDLKPISKTTLIL